MAVETLERALHGQIAEELELVRTRSGDGKLRTQDVVEFARDETTALHSQFEWDDTKASYHYRLWQARRLIRAAVTVLPSTGETIEAYVSLTPNRHDTGGYTAMVDILSDAELYQQMLQDALREMELFEAKYRRLSELAPVFKAAKKVREKHSR